MNTVSSNRQQPMPDFEREGLLDGLEGRARDARLRLLARLFEAGIDLDRPPLGRGGPDCRTPSRMVLTPGERRVLCFVFRARPGARARSFRMTAGNGFSPETAVWNLTALER